MANEKVGVSLTKIIENGEKLASNIDRGVSVVEQRKTIDSFDRVCSKVEDFFNSIANIQLSGEYRTRVIAILKQVRPALDKLYEIKKNVIDIQSNQTEMSVSPSM